MRKHLATLLAALASVIFAGAEARAADIYVLSNGFQSGGAGSTRFGRIDSATGAYTSITNLPGDVWNLAWNPSANQFFVTALSSVSANLRTLSTTGTLSASLGTIGLDVYGMAYRTSDSTLYAFDYGNNRTGTINTANGAWSTLNSSPGVSADSPLGGRPLGGRYSIMNDTMYFAGNFAVDGIGTMGYTASSTYQQIASNSDYANMVLANDGTTMYGIFGNGTAGQQRLYTIDVATGTATPGAFITGTGLGTYFHGAATTVPEPSTWALGAIASGVLGVMARRRKKARRA